MTQLYQCPTCGRNLSENARSCPGCGETQFYKTVYGAPETRPCGACGGRGKTLKQTDYGASRGLMESCYYCGGRGHLTERRSFLVRR